MSSRHHPKKSPVLPSGLPAAKLRVGDTDVSYSSQGAGAPVLLLVGDPQLRNHLQSHLATSFRVVAPAIDSDQPELGSTALLRALIDGLGLDRPCVVASDSHALAALHFTAGDPERVDRIAVLWREQRGESAEPTTLQDRFAVASAPILLVQVQPWNDDAEHRSDELTALISFLESPSFF